MPLSQLESVWSPVVSAVEGPTGPWQWRWYDAVRERLRDGLILLLRPPPLRDWERSGSEPRRIVLWGTKRSGKTAIMYRWKLGAFIPTVPTVGVLETEIFYGKKLGFITEIGRDPLSMEKTTIIDIKNDRNLVNYDDNTKSNATTILEEICSCCCCRRKSATDTTRSPNFAMECWFKLARSAHTIVYVVDSSCRQALIEMCDELSMILNDDFVARRGLKVLVIANKQDVWGAVSATDIERMLNGAGRCTVLGSSALTGMNLDVALTHIFDDDP